MKTWFITGISRGLGLALAKAILARGDSLVGTARANIADLSAGLDPSGKRLRVLPLDLADPVAARGDAIEEVVRAAFAHTGRVDVLVNNAGYGLLGALEQSTDAELQRLFDVDLFGPIRIIRAALPRLRAQRSGHILNVTSIAGRAPGAASSAYSAAKGALEALSAGLAQEVAPAGIRVTAVAPGAFRTDFLSPHSLQKSSAPPDDYAATVTRALGAFDAVHGAQLGDPARGAEAILRIVDAESPPLHVLLGSDALTRTRAKLQAVTEEIERWEAVTKSTDGTSPPSR